jgi:hypothetical protein
MFKTNGTLPILTLAGLNFELVIRGKTIAHSNELLVFSQFWVI